MPQAQGMVEQCEVRNQGGDWRLVTIMGQKYSCWDSKLFPQLFSGNVITFEFKETQKDGRTYRNLLGILPPGTQPAPPPQVGGHPVTGSPPPQKYGKSEREQRHIMRMSESGHAATEIGPIVAAAITSGQVKVEGLDGLLELLKEVCQAHINFARTVEMEFVLGFSKEERIKEENKTDHIAEPNWDESPGTPEERGEVG